MAPANSLGQSILTRRSARGQQCVDSRAAADAVRKIAGPFRATSSARPKLQKARVRTRRSRRDPRETVDPFTGNLRTEQVNLVLPRKTGVGLKSGATVRSRSSELLPPSRADEDSTATPELAPRRCGSTPLGDSVASGSPVSFAREQSFRTTLARSLLDLWHRPEEPPSGPGFRDSWPTIVHARRGRNQPRSPIPARCTDDGPIPSRQRGRRQARTGSHSQRRESESAPRPSSSQHPPPTDASQRDRVRGGLRKVLTSYRLSGGEPVATWGRPKSALAPLGQHLSIEAPTCRVVSGVFERVAHCSTGIPVE